MSKTLDGVVKSMKRGNVITVEVTRKVQHPKYKKLMTRSKKFSVSLKGQSVKVGDQVTISETRPVSKTIHFEISKSKTKEDKL